MDQRVVAQNFLQQTCGDAEHRFEELNTFKEIQWMHGGAFLLIDFQLQAPALHGDSHEKWIKETGLDISAGARAEDNGPQENPRRRNCQEVETD
jgi:hypothetical protein